MMPLALIFDLGAIDKGIPPSMGPLIQWFGNFHPIFLHFPIVLILLAGLTELLYAWNKNPFYDFVIKFMLVAAAIFIIPTVLSGLAFQEGVTLDESNRTILWWHRFFGIVTLILTFVTLLIRISHGRHGLYFVSLILLIGSVLTTSYLGGLMTFGPFSLLPPLS